MAGFFSQFRRYWGRKTRTIRKNNHASARRRLTLDTLEDRTLPAPLIGAAKVDTLAGDVNSDGNVDPGDTILYTVTIANNGAAPGPDDAQGVRFEDVLDPNTTLGAVNVSPLARDDVYSVVANVQLRVGNPAPLPGPSVDVPGSATLNDSEFLGDTFTIATFQATSANGGAVSMVTTGANIGSFSYVPALNFTGTDTFTYTLTDAGLDGNIATTADNLTSVGVVTINVGAQNIWYVDNAYAGANGPSDGSSTRPFTSLADVTGATGPDVAGDIIYVSAGNGNYDGNMTLLANQTLWGQGEALVVGGVTLRAAGPAPTLTNTSGTAVTLATNNTLKGFNVGDSLNTDIAGANFGTLTVSNVALFGAGRALSLSTGNLAATFSGISSANSFADGITLTAVGGSLTVTGGTTISNPSGAGINVQNAGAGTLNFGAATVTGAGQIASVRLGAAGAGNVGTNVVFTKLDLAPAAGVGGLFADSNSGTITVSNGTITTNGANGISLTNNPSGAFHFIGGGLVIHTNGGIGFNATDSGTLSVQGSGNTINSVSDAALHVVNTTIAADGLRFQSISAGNTMFAPRPSNGMTLSNTGALGRLIVTGTGTVGSGGTIQNTTGDGIVLAATQNVSLSNINVTNNQGNGIFGQGVHGIVLNSVIVSGNARSASQAGILIHELTGDATHVTEFIKLTVSNSFADNVRIVNTGGNLANLLVTGSTFSNEGTTNSGGAEFVFESAPGGLPGTPTMKLTAIGNIFIGNNAAAVPPARGLSIEANDGTINARIGDGTLNNLNFFSNNVTGVAVAQSSSAANGTGGVVNFDINTNVFTASDSHAINVSSAGDLARTLDGFIRNNFIGTQVIANSGSRTGAGIRVAHESAGVAKVLIANNDVRNIGAGGAENIVVSQLAQPGTLHVTITNNILRDNAASRAITVNASQSGAAIIANVEGNSIANVGDASAIRFMADGPGAADGTINVPQANAAAISAANGGATVATDARVFFSQAPPLPPSGTPLLFAPAAPAGEVVAPVPPPATVVGILSQDQLDALVAAAIARWQAVGLTARQLDVLRDVEFSIGDLPGWYLGESRPGAVTLDADAAGNSWFIDSTPMEDSEFAGAGTALIATFHGGAAGRIDALTTIMHELGHQLGLDDTFDHAESANLMYGWVRLGERRLAAFGQADGAVPHGGQDGPDFLFTPIDIGHLPAGKSVTVVFQATVNNPFTGATPQVSNQGAVKFTGGPVAGVLTDDPSVGGAADPTVTPIDLPDISVQVANSPTAEDTGPDLVYTFTRDSVSASPLTVRFTISGTANNDDYALSGATFVSDHWEVVIPANQLSAAVNLNPTTDNIVEPNETAILTLLGGSGYTIGASSAATGTITNDDTATVTLSGGGAVLEGNSGTTILTFTATLSNPVQGGFQVAYSTNDGTATVADNDYVDNDSTLTFLGTSGESKSISVIINGDTTIESDETFTVSLVSLLGAPAGVTIAGSPRTGTILNDDAVTSVGVAVSPSATPEDIGADLVYTFTRSVALPTALTVKFSITGTSASNDYVLSGATFVSDHWEVVIPANQLSAAVNLNPTADNIVEPDETAIFTLLGDSGYTIGTPSAATGTITNDDTATVTLSGGGAVLEGNSGTTILTFTATLSNPVQGGFQVAYTTNDGTATVADNDYVDNDNTLTFAGTSGESKSISVIINGDTTIESDETFTVALASLLGAPAGVTIAGSPRTGTILNDDAVTSVGVAVSPSATPEDIGADLVYTFTRSVALPTALTVKFSIAGTSASNDYVITGATFVSDHWEVVIPANQLSAAVNLNPTADNIVEPDETAIFTLLGDSGYTIGTPSAATGTITNDDTTTVTLSGGGAVFEGNSGTTIRTFTATLGNPVQGGFQVAYTTNDGTATVADNDYVDNDGSLTFVGTSGESKSISITINGDSLFENDETFTVALGAAIGAPAGVSIVGSPQTGTIANDDAIVTVAVAPSESLEDTGPDLVYTFTRTGYIGGPLVVHFNVSGAAKLADNDFTVSGATTYNDVAGSVTFDAGSATKTLTLNPTADTTGESDETVTFSLTATAASGYTIGAPASATATIKNDDDATTVSISKVNDGAESGAAVNGTFRVTLSKTSSTDTVVTYGFGGTASAADFTASTSVTIFAGSLTADFDVIVINDRLVEGTETVVATLVSTNNPAITVAGGSATLDILDNDIATIAFQLANDAVTEGAALASIGVQLTLVPDANGTGPIHLARDVSVNVLDATVAGAGKATAGADYTFTSPTTVTFSAGVTYAIPFTTFVSVGIVNDGVGEAVETLDLQLANLVDSTGQVSLVVPTQHALAILDDDSALVSITAPIASASEAGTPASGRFRVALSLTNSTDTVIEYAVGGTATPGSDYTPLGGTITISAGSLVADFDVAVLNDALVEGTESVVVTLSSITSGGPNVAIDNANKSATVQIVDNDTATLAITAATDVTEAGGAQAVTVTLTTSDGAGGFATLGAGVSLIAGVLDLGTGTAVAGTHYSFAAGQTVTFSAGDGNAAIKNVTLTPINNGLADGDRTVNLQLQPLNTTLNGQASLGNTDGAVTIKDDGAPPISTANVSGVLFIDYDADAVQDANEAGVAGRTVFLDKNNDGVAGAGEPTAVTGANGAYSFTGVAPGSYTLRLATVGFEQGVGANGQGANLVLTAGDVRAVHLGLRTISAVSPLPVDSQVFAGAIADDATALVQGYYHAILGRAAEAPAVAFWTDLLRATSRENVIQAMLASDEFRGLQVQGYYQILLGRAPAASEVAFWVGQMRAGLSSTDVAIAFMTLTEFTNKHPTSPSFVDSLYRLLLSREADAIGRAVWIGLLDSGQATRADVIRGFFDSIESRIRALDAAYAQLLQRPVEPAAYAFYVPNAATGGGLNQVFVTILSSQEFLSRRTI